jgi:hypothetical protein
MMNQRQRLNQEHVHERESAVERLQSRWSSSSLVIVDIPPSQPLNRRQTSGRPSSDSVKESRHKDPGTGDPRRGSAVGRLQRRRSKRTFGYGVIAKSPLLQPLSSVAEEEPSEFSSRVARLSSGSPAAFGTASSQALVVIE